MAIITLAIALSVIGAVVYTAKPSFDIEKQLPQEVVINEVIAVRTTILTANMTQEQAKVMRDKILAEWKTEDSIMKQLDRQFAK